MTRRKFAISSYPYAGPWGGGNRFVASLVEELHAHGHLVVHRLDDDDVDLILLVDPRRWVPHGCFGPRDIARYLVFTNPSAVVVHRVNECDERKNTRFINSHLLRANYYADHTIFISSWLSMLPIWRNHGGSYGVITNGADKRIFNADGFVPWPGTGPMRLVTHHWGCHEMKGFDIYRELDRLVATKNWRNRIEFTYVGNLPPGFKFANSRHVKPLDGEALAKELRSHHAYVTGSINEPGGMHQHEGALCGLPLVYRVSGGVGESCVGYGVGFTRPTDFEQALIRLFVQYDQLIKLMPAYPYTASKMVGEWMTMFERLLSVRSIITRHRRLWRRPHKVIANLAVP